MKREIQNKLSRRDSFGVEGFDYRLLPLFLPSVGEKTLIVFEDSLVDCPDNLSLLLEGRGVFINKDLLAGPSSPSGFSGWSGVERERFLSSLSSGFSNHQFVLVPFSLYEKEVFPKHSIKEEVVVDKNTSYNSLVSWMSLLKYKKRDYVGSPGDFAVRGFVVDFFPFDSSLGVRAVFDGPCLDLFYFDVSSQLTVRSLESFVLVKSCLEKKLKTISSFFKSSFSRCFIYKNKVLFNSLSPDFFYKNAFKPLSPLECSSFKGSFEQEDSLCLVGYQYKSKTYIPKWLQQKETTPSLLSDVYVDFSSLSVGDYLIHEDFGVGQYLGLKDMVEGECLVLGFAGGKINVFPKYFNKISFFKRAEFGCSLARIGSGGAWKKKVARVKKDSSVFVERLVRAHVERQKVLSDVYYLDKELESSFLKGFVFKDTIDQKKSWGEIKKDLLSSFPMDRLLCGDVGFGKTEVAIRSVFVAGINGFSSLVLAPTTVLAKQLYGSFLDRLSRYGLSVGYVSRFVKKSDHKKIFSQFLENKIDVLVGTHSIINNESCLKKASLVVVDDEHRFGVKQKDFIKEVNPKVNMLYMSATPIPRTLKLALSEFKGLSVLSTPPSFKQPTKTYVDYFSKKTIKRALSFELSRGGQALFVHNNVKTMPGVVSFIKDLFPGCSIGSLHGQEPPSKIEKKMGDFVSKKTSILIASSIVECGIDLPNVNTVIVNNSQLFGVSQLYQIRGRVGRSFRSSFAYLLVPKKKVLSSVSKRRLKSIEKNSALGSCYSVSMEDLNIRGSGDLFGLKQSGGEIVGVDLYSKILKDLVASYHKKDVAPLPFVSCESSAFIPSSFLPSVKMRVWFYKELSQTSLESFEGFLKKTRNLFGRFPLELKNLVGLRRVFLLSQVLFFSKVALKDNYIVVFPVVSFWEKKSSVLINSLSDLGFVFIEGGEGFKVPCLDNNFFIIFDKIYNRLHHAL